MPDVTALMEWEDGAMTPEEERALFQQLVDSGAAWELQGMYGRRAVALIESGAVEDTHGVLTHA